MDKQVIQTLQQSLPALFHVLKKQKQDHISMDYDREADVVYVAFDDNKKADNTEVFSDDILLRKRNNALIGLTILHASSLMGHN